MHQFFFKSILKLKENASDLNKSEIKETLVEIEKEAEDFLQEKLIPRELIKEILQDVRSLQEDLADLDKTKINTRLVKLDDKGGQVDDAIFFMQSGTGEYLKNAKEAAEKKRQME